MCDQALKHCTKNAISIQARFYNLKGRILQAIAFDQLRQVKERAFLGQSMDGLERVDDMLPLSNPAFAGASSVFSSEDGGGGVGGQSSSQSSMRRERREGRSRMRSNTQTQTQNNQDMRAGARPVVEGAAVAVGSNDTGSGAKSGGGGGDRSSGSVTPRGSRSKSTSGTHSAPSTGVRSRSLKRSLSRRRKKAAEGGGENNGGIKRGSMFGNKRDSNLQAPAQPMSPERKEGKRTLMNGNESSPMKFKKRGSHSRGNKDKEPPSSPNFGKNRSKRPSLLMLEDAPAPSLLLGGSSPISLLGGGDDEASTPSAVEVMAMHMPNVRKCVAAFTTAYDLYKKVR